MATLGARTVGEFSACSPAYSVETMAREIQCPTLITDGEGDFASHSQRPSTCSHVKRNSCTLRKPGAGGLGQTLWEEETVFDWLDDLFG
jgi:hypothetical protein